MGGAASPEGPIQTPAHLHHKLGQILSNDNTRMHEAGLFSKSLDVYCTLAQGQEHFGFSCHVVGP